LNFELRVALYPSW